MTDADNVMPLRLRPLGPRRDRPAAFNKKKKAAPSAMRTRRYRERQKERQATVTVTPVEQLPQDISTTVVTAPETVIATAPISSEISNDFNRRVTHMPGHRTSVVTLSATASALALATVSAGFSITGMTSIFIGSFWPVIAMGVALEAGKLSAVSWLARHRATAPWRLRTALAVLVAVLMALNAIGAYGFLAKAHIGHAVDGDVAMASVAAEIDANVAIHAGVVADLDRRIAQIDGAVEKATSKGRTNGAMVLADQQRRVRADLVTQRTAEAKTIASLQVERAKVDGARRKVEADLGPVKYLATLLGAKDDDVLRWFILAVALLLDPAAVLLLAAATKSI